MNDRNNSMWTEAALGWIIALAWIAGCVSYISRPYQPGPTQPVDDLDSLDSGPWPRGSP